MVVYSFYIFDRHGRFPCTGSYHTSLTINCCNSRVYLQTTLASPSGLDHKQIFPTNIRSLNPEQWRNASVIWTVCADNGWRCETHFRHGLLLAKHGPQAGRRGWQVRPLPLRPLIDYGRSLTVRLLVLYSFVSYRTNQYKLHYFETPTNIKFVMLTDLKSPSMRLALEQIYINLYVEYGMWWRVYIWMLLTGISQQWLRTRCHPWNTLVVWESTMSFSKNPWNSLWYVILDDYVSVVLTRG